jgi:hypothetical protein
VEDNGVSLLAPISVWWMGISYAIGGISEIFICIPRRASAYSHASKNLKGVVFALYLLQKAASYIIGLASSSVIKDPYLTWDLGGNCIACVVLTSVFWIMFRNIDKEEYRVSTNGDYHLEIGQGAHKQLVEQTKTSGAGGVTVVETISSNEIGEEH